MEMKERNEEYRRTTDNMLEAVRIKTNWDESVVPVYESKVPHISVPGSLEFIGLYSPVEKLLQKGLGVYLDPSMRFDGKFIDDLFVGLTESERLNLLQSCDPIVLGFAAMTLRYYQAGWEDGNGILTAQIITTSYENNPLSQELTDEIVGFVVKSKNMRTMQEIELNILAELSEKVKQGFKIGRKK